MPAANNPAAWRYPIGPIGKCTPSRGDPGTIAPQGDYGKPHLALVIQANLFDALGSVTVLPVTSTPIKAPLLRIPVQPDADNGLQRTSQVMVDKVMTVKRDKLGLAFGHLAADTLVEVERCLAVFLGIAK